MIPKQIQVGTANVLDHADSKAMHLRSREIDKNTFRKYRAVAEKTQTPRVPSQLTQCSSVYLSISSVRPAQGNYRTAARDVLRYFGPAGN